MSSQKLNKWNDFSYFQTFFVIIFHWWAKAFLWTDSIKMILSHATGIRNIAFRESFNFILGQRRIKGIERVSTICLIKEERVSTFNLLYVETSLYLIIFWQPSERFSGWFLLINFCQTRRLTQTKSNSDGSSKNKSMIWEILGWPKLKSQLEYLCVQ